MGLKACLCLTWAAWAMKQLTLADQENIRVFSMNSSRIILEELVGLEQENKKLKKSIKHFIKAGVICSTERYMNPPYVSKWKRTMLKLFILIFYHFPIIFKSVYIYKTFLNIPELLPNKYNSVQSK